MALPVIPGYEILRIIGRGGMGRVYQARDLRLGRTVAIKMLVDTGDDELVLRFAEEAKAIASLSHPNIARLFEFGETEHGLPYCVMEFVGGGTLAAATSGRPLAGKQAALLTMTLARAVHAAHRAGIVHRDLKPSNVLIDGPPHQQRVEQGDAESENGETRDAQTTVSAEDRGPEPFAIERRSRDQSESAAESSKSVHEISPESLRVADFGLARRIESDSRITRTGQIVGTPAYMAPEQASGVVTRPGPGADVYSLGAILYELLTGSPPFLGTDTVETIMRLLSEDPPAPRSLLPSIPADLQTICLKCLQKKPSRRYLSADELADELQRFLDGRPILARPVSTAEMVRKWASRNPWKATAVSVLAVSTVVTAVGAAALQSAYRETLAANHELRMAIDEANDSFQLSQDALKKIVNRIRDDLYEVPQATALMLLTSRESAELHRRLHALRPDDLSAAQELVASLDNLALSEWVHGSRESSIAATNELQALLKTLRSRHPDDLTIAVAWAKLLLEKVQYPEPQATAAEQQQYQQQMTEAFEQLLRTHPNEPEVLKLCSQQAQLSMSQAVSEGDIDRYFREADRRVDLSRRYCETAPAEDRAQARLWLIQAQRVLADSLAARRNFPAAVAFYQQAAEQLQALTESAGEREYRSQAAAVWSGLGTAQFRLDATESGLQSLHKAETILLSLVQDFPEDPAYQADLAALQEKLTSMQNDQTAASDTDTVPNPTPVPMPVPERNAGADVP